MQMKHAYPRCLLFTILFSYCAIAQTSPWYFTNFTFEIPEGFEAADSMSNSKMRWNNSTMNLGVYSRPNFKNGVKYAQAYAKSKNDIVKNLIDTLDGWPVLLVIHKRIGESGKPYMIKEYIFDNNEQTFTIDFGYFESDAKIAERILKNITSTFKFNPVVITTRHFQLTCPSLWTIKKTDAFDKIYPYLPYSSDEMCAINIRISLKQKIDAAVKEKIKSLKKTNYSEIKVSIVNTPLFEVNKISSFLEEKHSNDYNRNVSYFFTKPDGTIIELNYFLVSRDFANFETAFENSILPTIQLH